jgi:hypothetical protein
MTIKISRTDVIRALVVHSQKLNDLRREFIMKTLDKYGPPEALYALYVVLFVIKEDKELFTYSL